MSSEAQNVIAEVVAKHEFDGVERDRIRDRIIGLCSCGKRVRTHPRSSHAEHVAEEIDKALGGLRRETRVIESIFELGVPEPATRFVTHWMEIPDE
ncbi:hypothetical protein SOLON_60 [Mycobacterium phage Solon]|uniref:Uncharacterized protein n=1 Tax=Mycobacterium phage Solon TaxID=555603 RepID=B5LLR3_9CAUD|nr:hypothetical protein SOLON_60 [Mycobacterium phage Solon]ACH62959.1 hypothetical protein SOLON_60 [Mycobacterium phage Solon]